MKNNSVTIGVVMCIVCCVGALCIPSLFNTSSDMSSGWNPSNVYSDVITTDNNVFTEAELQSSPSMGTSIARVSTSSTRLFHHSPSAIAVSNWVQTSSSSNATNYTASSNANISKGATPSAGIYTSTGNQSSAQGGATSVISSSSLATSSLGNHSPLSANSSSATTRTTVAARGMSLVTGGVSNQPLAYAAQSSSPIQASYRGIPSMSGPMKAAPGLGGSEYAAFFDWLISQGQYLYEGMAADKYNPEGPEYWWFLQSDIYEWYLKYVEYCETNGISYDDWYKIMEWFESEANTFYRFPIGDGIGVLLFLSLLNIFFLYMHRREEAKKKKTQPIEQE